jgi:type I restriction enzyme S subunit
MQDGRIATDDIKRVAPDVEAKYGRTRLRGGEVLISLVARLAKSPSFRRICAAGTLHAL